MIEQSRINFLGRRRFLEVAAGPLAAVQPVLGRAANARLIVERFINPSESCGPNWFQSLNQIDASVLNAGYVEAGSVD